MSVSSARISDRKGIVEDETGSNADMRSAFDDWSLHHEIPRPTRVTKGGRGVTAALRSFPVWQVT